MRNLTRKARKMGRLQGFIFEERGGGNNSSMCWERKQDRFFRESDQLLKFKTQTKIWKFPCDPGLILSVNMVLYGEVCAVLCSQMPTLLFDGVPDKDELYSSSTVEYLIF